MRNYRDLQVWKKSHNVALDLYRVSQSFPREELYGMTSQSRRAAISIGANLAEGCGRQTSAELARFVKIAMGPASELDYHLLVCRDLGLLKDDDFNRLIGGLTEVRKMLAAFLSSVEEQIKLKSKAAGTA